MNFLLGMTLLICTPFAAFALQITSLKNNKAIIKLESEEIQVGDQIRVMSSDNKVRGILKIEAIKNGKALALLKGSATKDSVLVLAPKIKSPTASSIKTNPAKISSAKKTLNYFGATTDYSLTKMTIKPSQTSEISLTGSSLNFAGFYQRTLSRNIDVRIYGSYQKLEVSGTSPAPSCSAGYDCDVNISYLGIETLIQYHMWQNSKFQTWLGGGLGILFAMNKSSNILETSKITTNQTIILSTGFNYFINPLSFIPLQLDYAIFPDNQSTSANQIRFKIGYGLSF